jgi:hypothetical protein
MEISRTNNSLLKFNINRVLKNYYSLHFDFLKQEVVFNFSLPTVHSSL